LVLGLEEDRSATFHLGIGLAGYSEEDGAGGSSTLTYGAHTIPTRLASTRITGGDADGLPMAKDVLFNWATWLDEVWLFTRMGR
jgi:hypothetical protein